jgi:uncharacterized protein (TIGR02246 family)
MRSKVLIGLVGGLLAVLAAGVIVAHEYRSPSGDASGTASEAGEPGGDKVAAKEADEDASEKTDQEAIRKSSQEFVRAFDKGDAKAVASFWTEKGECCDDTGTVIRGRAAIEKTYAELFKENPKIKIEIEVRSLHFPSHDTAVEDGILRFKPAGPELPVSSKYSILHVREGGKWKVAIAREWGANEDKLEDLGWLTGNWVAKSKDREVQMNFEWNDAKTLIRGRFSVKEEGAAPLLGTQTIGLDPQTGQLHSWVFDDEGGRGQAVWARDGNRWVQDAAGILFDGTEYAAVNVLTPISEDEFIWRSVERIIGESQVPDSDPIKLRRVPGK